MVHQTFLQHKALKTCCLLRRNWLVLSHLCGSGKQFCSDTGSEIFSNTESRKSRQSDDIPLTFKDKLIRKHYWPSEMEVKKLQQLFPEPKKVIDDFFAPFEYVEGDILPKLEKKRQLGDNIYTSILTLKWPVTTFVLGKHKDEEASIHNAYLRACYFLKNIGLVQRQVKDRDKGLDVNATENIIKIFEELARLQNSIYGIQINNFRVANLLQKDEDGEVFWTSSIQVLWPISFTVISKSACLKVAYYESCLKALMKFKANGYLDAENGLNRKFLLSPNRYHGIPCHTDNKKALTEPDYELFVDASAYGLGAYLISQDDEKIRWLADRWVKDKIKFEPRQNSSFSEFYAFMTAFYTWKHKFIDKKIIVYSDNEYVINLINHGICAKKHSCYKLYLLLIKVCYKNNIKLVGVHVNRIQNAAADLLSRYDVNSFKKILPTAYEKPKKSKKLWFYNFNNDKKDMETNENGKSLDDEDPKPVC